MSAIEPLAIEWPPGSGTYNDIDSSTDYRGYFVYQDVFEQSAATAASPVVHSYPLATSASMNMRVIPLALFRNPGGAVTSATFHSNVNKWFGPESNRQGARWLKVQWHDGSTELRIPVRVEHIMRNYNGNPDAIHVTMTSPVGYFEDLTETSAATSSGSGSFTNDGNTRCPAILQMQGSSLDCRRWTITDNTGRGVKQYPVVLYSGTTGFTASESYVIVNGRSVPFLASGTSGNDYCWVFIDVPANGSTIVDIVRNTGVTNALADTLDTGNLSITNTNNAQLQWGITSFADVNNAPPGKSAMWYPIAISLTSGGPTDLGFEAGEGSSAFQVTQNSSQSGESQNANAIYCVTGIEAGSSSALTNVERVTASHTSQVRSFCRFKTPSSRSWADGWTQTGNGTVTTAIDVDSAVIFVIGIEPTGGSPTDGATLDISQGSGVITLALDSSKDLSFSSSDTTWMLIDGEVANSTTSQTITFDNVIMPDGTFEMDTNYRHLEKGFTIPGSGAILGTITETDAVDLFSLDPGSNSITETVNGDVTIKHRDAYSVAG